MKVEGNPILSTNQTPESHPHAPTPCSTHFSPEQGDNVLWVGPLRGLLPALSPKENSRLPVEAPLPLEPLEAISASAPCPQRLEDAPLRAGTRAVPPCTQLAQTYTATRSTNVPTPQGTRMP